MLKVVIDTNLLIDGSSDFYNFGNRIIDLVIGGELAAYANRQTLQENRLLVSQKVSDEEYQQRLEHFFDAVEPVETQFIRMVMADPEDNKILASAITAGADFLITSDKHLLDLGHAGQTQIVRPAEFWSRYEEETDEGWGKWLANFIQS